MQPVKMLLQYTWEVTELRKAAVAAIEDAKKKFGMESVNVDLDQLGRARANKA